MNTPLSKIIYLSQEFTFLHLRTWLVFHYVIVGYGILAESGFDEATCCGVIKYWEFYASRAGELHLVVWRKSRTIYTLAGKNVYIVPSKYTKQMQNFVWYETQDNISVQY